MSSASPTNPVAPSAGVNPEPAVQTIQGRDLFGRFTAGDEQAAEQQAGNQERTPVNGEVLVDDHGVARRVNLQELYAKATKADQMIREAELVKQASQASMVRNAAVAQLGERFEKMSPAKREKIMRDILAAESESNGNGNAAPATDDDPFAAPTPALPRELSERLQRLDQIERLAMTSAEVLAQMGQERQAQSLAQRVQQAMDTLPIFGSVPDELRESAREAILNDLMRNPQGDLEQIVLTRARKTADVDRRYRSETGRLPEAGMSPSSSARKPMSGRDLLNGGVLKAAREAARQEGVIL